MSLCANAESCSRCSDRSSDAGLTTRRVVPAAARASTSAAVMSIDPHRVHSRASASRSAARAVARIRSSWLARSGGVSRPPGK